MIKKMSAVYVLFLAITVSGFSQDYKVVIPQLSPTATEVYTKAIEAIIESQGRKMTFQVVPFARAVNLIETKQADIQSASIQVPDKTKWTELKYDYSTAMLVDVVFVLYTNKSKPVSIADIKAGNPNKLRIETDSAHLLHFPGTSPSTSIDGSLQKLAAGTIDGYIFAQGSTDGALKRLAFTNIKREFYQTLSAVFLLQKGARGGEVDRMITAGMAAIKANGKYKQIVGAYAESASQYVDWQP